MSEKSYKLVITQNSIDDNLGIVNMGKDPVFPTESEAWDYIQGHIDVANRAFRTERLIPKITIEPGDENHAPRAMTKYHDMRGNIKITITYHIIPDDGTLYNPDDRNLA